MIVFGQLPNAERSKRPRAMQRLNDKTELSMSFFSLQSCTRSHYVLDCIRNRKTVSKYEPLISFGQLSSPI